MNNLIPGFDRLLKSFDRFPRSTIGMFDTMEKLLPYVEMYDVKYPPYNIERKSDTNYAVEVAVAGFDVTELSVSVEQNQLVIVGEKPKANPDVSYLHRGLAARDFVLKFALADNVEVKSSDLKNGLLTVLLERIVPETAKPVKIEIRT